MPRLDMALEASMCYESLDVVRLSDARMVEEAQRMEREITLAAARAVGAAIDESKDTVMMSTTTLNYLLVAVAQGRVTIEHLPAFDKHGAPEVKAWIAPREG